ncbi:TPA: SAM-dependent methyltransferase, partial [Legionella pneumophila]|nr:SAM-dependent methyltransferase [Legionella pneumophila]HCR5126625.1 SAM-dependent methyltransferase [Legionella pneumophila]HCR5128611.1 SAM-dependent methyltransferase [Legionella pneumophila]HCR5131675.1 SAM-dependent methyltransferase [Legionella pneumophila]HCR5134445.1 SAM-dependent methyltransferase [Legionella pneumophila]
MEFLDFCKSIKVAVENYNKINGVLGNSLILLAELDKLVENKEVNQYLSMTQATIIFEGFYRHLSSESLKQEFQIIRA